MNAAHLISPLGERPARENDCVSGIFPTADACLVLLVDDNPVNLIAGGAILQILGFQVETAEDGEEAIAFCKKRPPQLVLMDVNMPVLDGLQATVQLRKLQAGGALPSFAILAFTADATAPSRRACERAGMDGFLTKPLLVTDLEAELSRIR